MKKRNIILSIIYAVFAIAGLIYTRTWTYQNTTGVAPSFWPDIMFGLMLITSIAAIILSVRGEDQEVEEKDKFNLRKSLPLIALVFLYILVFQRFGFLYPTIVFLLGAMYLFGERKLKYLIPISIMMPIVMYFLFTKVFHIYLP